MININMHSDINKSKDKTKKSKKKIPSTVRNSVWNKYIGKDKGEGKCFCCGMENISRANFQCGHVISEYNDGIVHIANLRPICGQCNTSMGTTNMDEFMNQYGYEKSKNWDGIKQNDQENLYNEILRSQIEQLGISKESENKISEKIKHMVKKLLNIIDEDVETHEELNLKYFKTLMKYTNDKKPKFIYTQKQKKYFEQYVFGIDTPYRLYIKRTQNGHIFINPKDFCSIFPEFSDFTKCWLQDANKNIYDKMDFRPDMKNCPHNVYNLFTGFDVVKNYEKYDIKNRDSLIKPILDHFMMLFNNNKNFVDYYLKLYANMFKNPEKKAGIAVIMRGPQGSGKNWTNTELWGKMLGKELYISDNNPNTFFDKHSVILQNKILINVDEVRGKDTIDVIEKLKGWITNPTMCIIPKKMTPIVIQLFACWVFTTNNKTPIPIDPRERRFIAIDTSDIKINDTKYFGNLTNLINKDWKVLSAFYDYLMSLDIPENYSWANNRPITEAYNDIKTAFIPSTIQYIIEKLDDLFEDEITGKQLNAISISAYDFLQSYLMWRKEGNFKDDTNMNSTLFGRLITDIKGITKEKCGTIKYKLVKSEIINFLTKNKYIDEVESKNKKEKLELLF